MKHTDSAGLDVALIGGGVTGLAVAHRLACRFGSGEHGAPAVRVFERAPRFGGLVRSERLDSCLLEGGPDAVVTTKPAALVLIREIGLASELVEPRSAAGFSLLHRGELHPLPAGFRMIAPTRLAPLVASRLFSPAGKLRMLMERWVAPPKKGDQKGDQEADESVESFVVRRFGREAFERVAAPVLGGLFVADPSRLSARRTLGPFVALEARYGSVSRGLRSTTGAADGGPPQQTLRSGMERLVERLCERLPASWLQGECVVERLRPPTRPGGTWAVETSGGVVGARRVVLACPCPVVRSLVGEDLPELGSAAGELGFTSCATVSLVYPGSATARLPRENGFFALPAERCGILAATYSSAKFEERAPDGRVVVRTFHGGALDPEASRLGDEQLIERSHRALAGALGLDCEPLVGRVFRFSDAMPQLEVGHHARVEALARRASACPGLYLAGSALGEYGLPDCIASAEQVARRLAESVEAGEERG